MKTFKRINPIVLFCLLLLSWSVAWADQTVSVGGQDSTAAVKELNTGIGNPGAWLVSIFRDYVSAVDGDRCPSAPSCSSFSVQAFKRHGFVMGWLMTVDRLIHEGKEETEVSPLVYVNGRLRIYDPVENNDFWWPKPDEDSED